MVIRYHWGHGVGHLYTHQSSEPVPSSSIDTHEGPCSDLLGGERNVYDNGTMNTEVHTDDSVSEMPSESTDKQGSDGTDYSEGDYNDAELFALKEMYGNTENEGNIE